MTKVAELARFLELRWTDWHHWVPTTVFGSPILWLGGARVLVWDHIVSKVPHCHPTFGCNSLAHPVGSRGFETSDRSRQDWLRAEITFREGWHDNRRFSLGGCRQEIRGKEIGGTNRLRKLTASFGLVRRLRPFRIPVARAQEAA